VNKRQGLVLLGGLLVGLLIYLIPPYNQDSGGLLGGPNFYAYPPWVPPDRAIWYSRVPDRCGGTEICGSISFYDRQVSWETLAVILSVSAGLVACRRRAFVRQYNFFRWWTAAQLVVLLISFPTFDSFLGMEFGILLQILMSLIGLIVVITMGIGSGPLLVDQGPHGPGYHIETPDQDTQ
jgi:hypothetical protein